MLAHCMWISINEASAYHNYSQYITVHCTFLQLPFALAYVEITFTSAVKVMKNILNYAEWVNSMWDKLRKKKKTHSSRQRRMWFRRKGNCLRQVIAGGLWDVNSVCSWWRAYQTDMKSITTAVLVPGETKTKKKTKNIWKKTEAEGGDL